MPVYIRIEEVFQHFPGWTPRSIRETLKAEGVTRTLGSEPGKSGRRLFVVVDLVQTRLPELYMRLLGEHHSKNP